MKTAPSTRPRKHFLLLAMAASGLVSCEVYPAGYYPGYANACPPPVYRPVPVVAPVPVPVFTRPWGGYYGAGYARGGYCAPGYGGYRGYGYGHHHGHCY